VIGGDGKVTRKLAWAAVNEVERELARLTGEPPPRAEPPDLAPIRAHLGGKPVLVQFVAPGCPACRRMDETTLADPDVQRALAGFEVVRLGVEQDAAWGLFEDLDLGGTPAFVRVAPDGTIGERRQGVQAEDAFLAFLRD
jgi:thiol:disulfide interchange protein